ncbi:hypothetical protein J2Z49_002946 [Desulfofundulus luciae]|uniref:PD-(D/E)XK nuclease domain-containing protein n=2 Tax=Desulfofundulus TaxID=2282741 RepID=A0A494WR79_9FIRM|nr:PD-(D/E)XK nuclease superfamily protein [Desulfofundulus luciae]MDQ0287813.1 hypothetical protein [Desulfofundulus luciae]RKO65676.1 hypothetical protein D7024_00965 [Desulfofundulus salinum]
MSPGGKGTKTGAVWEQVIRPVLDIHYSGRFQTHVTVGNQLFGSAYQADFVVQDDTGGIIVSAKWQQIRGTVEQKLLYDIASLISIIRNSDEYRKAYVVLGGTGFSEKARSFLLQNKHREIFADGHLVEVLSLEDFLARANKGEL